MLRRKQNFVEGGAEFGRPALPASAAGGQQESPAAGFATPPRIEKGHITGGSRGASRSLCLGLVAAQFGG